MAAAYAVSIGCLTMARALLPDYSCLMKHAKKNTFHLTKYLSWHLVRAPSKSQIPHIDTSIIANTRWEHTNPLQPKNPWNDNQELRLGLHLFLAKVRTISLTLYMCLYINIYIIHLTNQRLFFLPTQPRFSWPSNACTIGQPLNSIVYNNNILIYLWA